MEASVMYLNKSELAPFVVNNMRDLVTDSQKNYVALVLGVIVCGLISLFGIVSNIINMVVFYKQGLTTTINISFFALAVSDFGCMVFQQLCCLYSNPLFLNMDLPIVYLDFQYITTFIMREMFARTTCLITVYITAERCFCIAFPLHVKQIITPVRTATIMICCYTIQLLSHVPFFSTAYIAWNFYPNSNKTLLGLVYRENRDIVDSRCSSFQATMIVLEFITVAILTAVLIYKLSRKRTWLKSYNVDVCKIERTEHRNKSSMSMVILIASMLIICYSPCVGLLSVYAFVPDFTVGGIFVNTCAVLWAVAFFFEDINSSANIFIYYKMSTNYRITFRKCFLKSSD